MLRSCCLLAMFFVSCALAQEADVHPPPYRGETRINTFLSHDTRLARQQVLPERAAMSETPGAPVNNPFFKQEELGTDVIENVAVHGTRQTRTIPPAATGTGKDIVITDEYWYSDELHMNMLTKHTDPRTGVQILTITQVNRNEPDPAMFQVPAGYKVVDETPPN